MQPVRVKNSLDTMYQWVQKASAFCVLERKIREVKLTLAKARLYRKMERTNASGDSFNVTELIAYEERFLAALMWRQDALSESMVEDHGWDREDGVVGDVMLQKIALRHKAHASERFRGDGKGADFMWNVSVTEPWLVDDRDCPSPNDLADAAKLTTLARKLERVVWVSRGECPGWKNNLLEDMKDAVWLVLKGALKGGWYRVNERDSLMSADSARVRTLETLRAEAPSSFVGKMAAEMKAKNEKKKVRAEEEIATQNRLNSEKEVAQQRRRREKNRLPEPPTVGGGRRDENDYDNVDDDEGYNTKSDDDDGEDVVDNASAPTPIKKNKRGGIQ